MNKCEFLKIIFEVQVILNYIESSRLARANKKTIVEKQKPSVCLALVLSRQSEYCVPLLSPAHVLFYPCFSESTAASSSSLQPPPKLVEERAIQPTR